MNESVFKLLVYLNKNFEPGCYSFAKCCNLCFFNFKVSIPLDGFKHLLSLKLSFEDYVIIQENIPYPDYIITDAKGDLIFIWDLDK